MARTIMQIKQEWNKAKTKAEKDKLHAEADRIRNYVTTTKYDKNNTPYQAVVSTKLPPLPKSAPKKAPPRLSTSAKARTGTLPTVQKTQAVDFTLPMGKTIQVQANVPNKNFLGEAFDQKENYVDKLKQGNLGGAAANFLGTGLTGVQSLYLNTLNTGDSLTQGKGVPKFQPQMGFGDYEKAVGERRGEKALSEKIGDKNKVLGEAFKFAGEVTTDPSELTPFGFANDIKLAKGLNQSTQAYGKALQNGTLVKDAIGVTKGVQKGVQLAKGLKSVEKVPVLVNGKVTFTNVPKQAVETASKNVLAPTPRIVPTKVSEVAPKIKTEIPTTQQVTPIKAQNIAVQPQISNLQPTIQPEIKNVQTANLPTGKVDQKMKDLGADVNQFNTPQKTSRVATNTFKNSTMFNEAEKELLNNKDYAYDPVTEVQSLAQAKQRLETDFQGEAADLPNKLNFDGVDLDTSMGIMEKYLEEARATGDYSKVDSWAKTIQEKGTQNGQMIQAFAKYSRTPEGAVIKAKQKVAEVERDIKKNNPAKLEKVEKETKKVTEKIKELQDDAVNAISETVEKKIREIKPKGYAYKGSDTATQDAVSKLTDINYDELIKKYTASAANKLKNKIDIANPLKKTMAPLQQAFDDLTKELYAIAKETLPKNKIAKPAEIKATDILKAGLENKQNYQEVWQNVKMMLQQEYANNPEAMSLLSDFFDKDIIPSFSKSTISKAVTQTAKDFNVDLSKIIKQSQGDKDKLARDMQNYIAYQSGATPEEARIIANDVLTQYNEILKSKTESALKQMFPEAFGNKLPVSVKKSTYQKVMELINMGAYDNEAIKNIIKEKNNVPVLSNSDIKKIVDNMELSAKEEDPYMKNMYASKAEQIMSDKIPAEFRKKFRALQRLSMILHPKTLATRNPLGNTLLGLAENVKDVPAAALDKVISLKTGERTTAFAPIAKTKAQVQGFGQGLAEWGKDIKYGVDTSPSRGQFELPSGRVFKGKALNALDMFERIGLQLGDRPYYQAAYNGRMAELKKLGKVGEEAELDARLYALDRVFQNDSELSKRAVQIRKALGLPGDLIMPFTQTPANILDKLIDYSPAALGKAVYQLGTTAGKGTFNQKKFVDTLARSFTGAGISALTFAMMQKGLLKGSPSENTDLRNAQQLQGQQAYSIKIGDKWYSYDWAQPIAGIIAATSDAIKAGMTKDDFSEALMEGGTSAVNSIFNQSFLSGLLTAFSGYSPAAGIGSALLGSTSQITPTVGAAIAKTIDTTMRETYDPNRFKEQSNKLLSRTPFLSKLLPAKPDVAGQDIMQNQGRGLGSRLVENFLAPYKLSQETNDPVIAELLRLQDLTGENGVLLNKAEKTIKGIPLTADEYVQYQKQMGTVAYSEIKKLQSTQWYKSMLNKDKADMISKINTQAKKLAQYDILTARGIPTEPVKVIDYTNKMNYEFSLLSKEKQTKYTNLSPSGVTVEQYTGILNSLDVNDNGAVSQDEARQILDSSNLTREQKAKMWSEINKSWKRNPYN